MNPVVEVGEIWHNPQNVKDNRDNDTLSFHNNGAVEHVAHLMMIHCHLCITWEDNDNGLVSS